MKTILSIIGLIVLAVVAYYVVSWVLTIVIAIAIAGVAFYAIKKQLS